MPNDPCRRKPILILLIATIVLPIIVAILSGTAWLFASLGDATAASFLGRTALAGGLAWIIVMICLLLVLAWNSLADEPHRDETASQTKRGCE